MKFYRSANINKWVRLQSDLHKKRIINITEAYSSLCDFNNRKRIYTIKIIIQTFSFDELINFVT